MPRPEPGVYGPARLMRALDCSTQLVNTTNNNLRVPWISLGLLLLLVVLAPYAMSFPPYPAYASSDSLQPSRRALVMFGLSATGAAFVELLVVVRRARADVIGLVPFAAAFLACAVVGWRSYPYWATGVYQVGIGAFPPMDQDPKRLIPMIWIGDLWRLPVLLLYLLCYIGVPALLVAASVAFWRRRFLLGITTVLCISIVLIFMLGFSPDYVPWLMD
ncbi:MAG TPA: hypothetical protein VEC99_07580 [Clostridia bacterium]|nr:hypothetical protein [Clostridia bacterium]